MENKKTKKRILTLKEKRERLTNELKEKQQRLNDIIKKRTLKIGEMAVNLNENILDMEDEKLVEIFKKFLTDI